MTYDRTRTARPANLTDTPVASEAMMPAVFTAPGTVCKGRSADWAVPELYSLHYRALVRLAVLLVRDIPVEHVIDRQDTRHDNHLPQPLLVAMMRSPALTRTPNCAARRSEAEPHWYCNGTWRVGSRDSWARRLSST
jgi:hypothetical protein